MASSQEAAEDLSWGQQIDREFQPLAAFSNMISWSYYGLQSWKFLFGRGKWADLAYKSLFLMFVVIGASTTLNAVIKFSDAMILALVFPNMIGLFFLFPNVREELSKYLQAICGMGGK
jgi:AGCS family alanine or glycine:cation symporter